MSSDPRKLVFAIIKFLKSQLEEGQLSGECAEGVEVGIQCLEAAYNITGSEPSLDHPSFLQDIFHQYMLDYESQRVASPEEKAQAETLKNKGNSFMSALNFNEAIICYTKAIKLDPKNAVYYCNRAAASNKLGNFENAIQDCKIALTIDPNYSKAYGRLGLAYASLHKPQESIDNYRKALELEPDNDSYRANLKMAEEALASSTSSSTGSNPLHNLDLGMIFTNPNLLSMASQMLSNPSMQNMVDVRVIHHLSTEYYPFHSTLYDSPPSSLLPDLHGFGAPGMDVRVLLDPSTEYHPFHYTPYQSPRSSPLPALPRVEAMPGVDVSELLDLNTEYYPFHSTLYDSPLSSPLPDLPGFEALPEMSNILSGNMNPEGGPTGGGMEVLLQASQQLAQQMESENPALVEQLRRHMGGGGVGGGSGGDQADTADPSAGPNNKNEGA